TTSYLVPSSTQCRQCHVLSNVTTLIGPKARNLNRDFAYSTGTENQLAHWTSLGLLTGAPAPSAAPKLAVWNDPSTGTVDARARAYLETNCAHCHNAGGEARTTGLFLLTSETDPAVYGVCKQPVAAGPGSGGHTYDIVPGDPDNSILPFRMTSTQAGILMPQIGRSVEDKAGVALVRDWITGIAAGTSTCH
ncbi:MAG: hypothetical protein JST92_25870, partial [Deltaproteobacteria bacterium]|nr:hypothetical protein [Deltaproteobacteria bacterium]